MSEAKMFPFPLSFDAKDEVKRQFPEIRWDRMQRTWTAPTKEMACAARLAGQEADGRRHFAEEERRAAERKAAEILAGQKRGKIEEALANCPRASVQSAARLIDLISLYHRKGFLHADEEHEYWRLSSQFEALEIASGTRSRSNARMLPETADKLHIAMNVLAGKAA